MALSCPFCLVTLPPDRLHVCERCRYLRHEKRPMEAPEVHFWNVLEGGVFELLRIQPTVRTAGEGSR